MRLRAAERVYAPPGAPILFNPKYAEVTDVTSRREEEKDYRKDTTLAKKVRKKRRSPVSVEDYSVDDEDMPTKVHPGEIKEARRSSTSPKSAIKQEKKRPRKESYGRSFRHGGSGFRAAAADFGARKEFWMENKGNNDD